MELPKKVLDGLSVAGNHSEISDALYNVLVNTVFQVASGKSSPKEIEKRIEEYEAKLGYTSLLSLVLEAVKHDVDPTTLSSLLEDYRMDPDRISTFLKKFQENKEKIQLELSCIGRSFDRIVDVSWRQDYAIKSSNCEKICEPSYIVSLKTWNSQSNTESDVTFSCSMEQLQDLVLKLKDATKCIERCAA